LSLVVGFQNRAIWFNWGLCIKKFKFKKHSESIASNTKSPGMFIEKNSSSKKKKKKKEKKSQIFFFN
jgi:hypothetical protein